MSFIFRELHMENWLAYADCTTIRFPDFQPGRNLIVIYGLNGFGKTSLLRALRYVFEGQRLSKDELLNLWHHATRDTGEGCLEVALEFTHGERQCKIIRGCDFKLRGRDVFHSPRVDLFLDGRKHEDLVEDKIQEILPRDCLDVLFFDGAEISRYALRENDDDTREAIEKILGIPAARNLREDLSKVIKSLEKDQQMALQGKGQAQELVLNIGEVEDELDRYRERRSNLVAKKRSLEKIRAELEADLEKLRIVEKDLESLREKKHRRNYIDEQIRDTDSRIQILLARLPLFMLKEPLRQIAEEMRAREQVSPRTQTFDARLRTLNELIDKNECLCGREIDSEIRVRLLDQLSSLEKMLEGREPGTRGPSDELVNLSALLRFLKSQSFAPDELIDLRAELNAEMEEVNLEIARLKRLLEGHPDADVADVSQQVGQLDQQLLDLGEEIRAIEDNMKRKETELLEKKRALDQLGVADEQAKGVTRTLQTALKAHDTITDLLNSLVEEKRNSIEVKATEVFRDITNKPEEYDCLRLRKDYSLEVVRQGGTILGNEDLSSGEKEVVAYSFITALNLSSPDPAPFVMDTPFGHLDSGHRHGLLTSLPNLEVQVFLLATDRDLPQEERNTIDRFIAKEFVLRRDQHRATTWIEEDDS